MKRFLIAAAVAATLALGGAVATVSPASASSTAAFVD